MPYATNNGIRIHFQLEGNAEGPPLVVQHGFSLSMREWYMRGYVAALGERYHLIMIDARGHGQSDKPHDPEAYRVALHAADVVAVLDDLGIERAHFLGYSMGGLIGFALGMHAPERCLSLVLGGDGATDRDPDDPLYRWVIDTLRQGIDAWADTWEGNAPAEVVERQRRNDPEALLATRLIYEQRGFAAALPRFALPCLIYAGDADAVHADAQAAAALIPHAHFVSFPGLNHGLCFSRSDLVLPHITAFLAEADVQRDSA